MTVQKRPARACSDWRERHRDVLDALVMQRARKMMMIDDVVARFWTEHDRDHVLAEKFSALFGAISRQRLRLASTSRMPTVIWVGRRSAMATVVSMGSRTMLRSSSKQSLRHIGTIANTKSRRTGLAWAAMKRPHK